MIKDELKKINENVDKLKNTLMRIDSGKKEQPFYNESTIKNFLDSVNTFNNRVLKLEDNSPESKYAIEKMTVMGKLNANSNIIEIAESIMSMLLYISCYIMPKTFEIYEKNDDKLKNINFRGAEIEHMIARLMNYMTDQGISSYLKKELFGIEVKEVDISEFGDTRQVREMIRIQKRYRFRLGSPISIHSMDDLKDWTFYSDELGGMVVFKYRTATYGGYNKDYKLFGIKGFNVNGNGVTMKDVLLNMYKICRP